MPKRQKGPTIQELKGQIRDSLKQWREIKRKGAGERSCEDGTALYLVRNHIIHDQGQLRELCRSEKVRPCPGEARLKLPPQFPMDYCAPKSKSWPCVELRKADRKRKKAP
jgi:hypothetical protein